MLLWGPSAPLISMAFLLPDEELHKASSAETHERLNTWTKAQAWLPCFTCFSMPIRKKILTATLTCNDVSTLLFAWGILFCLCVEGRSIFESFAVGAIYRKCLGCSDRISVWCKRAAAGCEAHLPCPFCVCGTVFSLDTRHICFLLLIFLQVMHGKAIWYQTNRISSMRKSIGGSSGLLPYTLRSGNGSPFAHSKTPLHSQHRPSMEPQTATKGLLALPRYGAGT